jgi:hypothetical protein
MTEVVKSTSLWAARSLFHRQPAVRRQANTQLENGAAVPRLVSGEAEVEFPGLQLKLE